MFYQSMKKEGMILVLLIILLVPFGCKSTEERSQGDIMLSNPNYSHQEECLEKIMPGIINVKIRKGYDISTPDKLNLMINKMVENNSGSKEPLESKKIFTSSKEGTKNKEIQDKVGLNRWIQIKVPKSTNLEEELEKWKLKSEVEYASLEYIPCLITIPLEFDNWQFKTQWYHNNTGDNFATVVGVRDADIGSLEAWDFTTGGEIIIGNPDTSVFWEHEDLVDNIWQNLGEDLDGDGKVIQPNGTALYFYENLTGAIRNRSYTPYIFDPDDINGIDDDGNGYIDDFIGWDFYSEGDNNPIYNSSQSQSYQWHGTSTTGSVAETGNNSLGGTGTCWNCKVIAMRGAVGNGNAVKYTIDNGAKIITISWMSSYSNAGTPLADALYYAHEMDVVILAGAGNFGQSTNWFNSLCDSEDVICVGGSTVFNSSWYETSYGPSTDISSPSEFIRTTFTYNHPLNIYGIAAGTSLGTPIAAGVVGLMLTENPDLTPDEVKSILQTTSRSIIIPNGMYLGTGEINAKEALEKTNQSKLYGGFPVALINANTTTTGVSQLYLRGTADSKNFSKYEIYYSEGHYSTDWVLLEEGYEPVQKDLISAISYLSLPLGGGQIKLVVKDTNNQSAHDTFPFELEGYPTPIFQQVDLKQGWNTFSPLLENDTLSSEIFDLCGNT